MNMKRLSTWATSLFASVGLPVVCWAQVNSGSNGSDGAFNPAANTVINMADHPNGIYQYTSVNISIGVTVTFIPNANNTPVVWLVQSNVVINGSVDVSGQTANVYQGGLGGPGGYRGGNGGTLASDGQGPGGGTTGVRTNGWLVGTGGSYGDGASFYGNQFMIPLLGGSGGAGETGGSAGGGGGGAILVAASGGVVLQGTVLARGGNGDHDGAGVGGGGSGGAVRLVATHISGNGTCDTVGGSQSVWPPVIGGLGRVRLDSPDLNFGGTISGIATAGYQPIIIAMTGQGAQLTVTSVGGVPVSASPTGQIVTPDAVISAQQNNPIPIVVSCANLPLNTPITVSVKPANGAAVSAVGYNSTGTLASSTATISINIPRGGGLIYATAATSN
jgi:hypothetical protein